MPNRRIRFTAIMSEPIFADGDDEREIIGELIEANLPSGAELLDWQYVD